MLMKNTPSTKFSLYHLLHHLDIQWILRETSNGSDKLASKTSLMIDLDANHRLDYRISADKR